MSQEHRSAGQINMLYHIKIDKYLYRHIQVVNLESAIFWVILQTQSFTLVPACDLPNPCIGMELG